MPATDSIVADLVHQMNAIAQRNYLQRTDAVAALQAPAFEEFLTTINLGVALYSHQGHFFYVSKSLSRLLGYTLEATYAKGPVLLQQITTDHDRPLVEKIMQATEAALKKITYTVSYPRLSFDYHIQSAHGILKRVHQHLLPNAIAHNNTFYTLFILHDFTGFKTSPLLNYRLSYIGKEEKFVTLSEGSVAPPCPYEFTKSEKEILTQLAAGKSMTTIAREKHISPETLKKHRSNILRKAGTLNMVAVLRDCLKNGWLAE